MHVAEWVEGEKLSQSAAGDVSSLVAVGMIAYLTQVLSIRQHTSVYVSIRQHTSAYVSVCVLER